MERLKNNVPILICTLILMVPAFWNGYPIVYSDTSTYLASGFIPETPFDRPITYGLLLRFFSLNGLSLWLVTFFQSFFLSLFLIRISRRLLPSMRCDRYAVLGVMMAAIFSTVAWYTSLLIADVFTSIAFLALMDVLSDDRKMKKKGFALLVYVVAVSTHLGHISQFLTFLFCVWCMSPYLFGDRRKLGHVRVEVLFVMGLTAASVVLMGSALAKSKHAFLLGAMLENGVLDVVLDGECLHRNWQLCQYRDELPDRAWEFIWEEESPFYALGSFGGTRDEFNEIIAVSLSKPQYICAHTMSSIQASVRQLMTFGVADGTGAFGEGSSLHERMENYVPHELVLFDGSRQAEGKLRELPILNQLYTWGIVACLPFLVLFMIRRRRLDVGWASVIALVVIFVVINAWVNGTFANAIPRLGGKVIWLLPWVTFMAGISLLRLHKSQGKKQSPLVSASHGESDSLNGSSQQ